MTVSFQALVVCVFCLAGALLLAGCDNKPESEDRVLKVGVIAPLSGPAQSWGEATLHSAQVVADYYNQQGGIEIEGERLKIELVIEDDFFDPDTSVEIAHRMVEENISYVIGPVGGASVSAASSVLDASGVFYVHYGFNQELRSESSLGVLGMPKLEQSLPLLYKHLNEERGVESLLVMAYDSGGSLQQKSIAEYLAMEHGIDLVKLSRFDVAEESFDASLSEGLVRKRVSRITEANPDLLVLIGCPPSVFVVLVDRLRIGGYDGIIAAQDFQDVGTLTKLGEIADDVYFVGGLPEGGERSDYYSSVRNAYLDRSGGWGLEAETKIYALEFILECIRQTGLSKYNDSVHLLATLESMRFDDPFYDEPKEVAVSNLRGVEDLFFRGMQLPIRLSKIQNGESVLVVEKSMGGRGN